MLCLFCFGFVLFSSFPFFFFFFFFLNMFPEIRTFLSSLGLGPAPPPFGEAHVNCTLIQGHPVNPGGWSFFSELLASATPRTDYFCLKCGGLTPCVLSSLILWSCVVSFSLAGSALKRLCLGKEHSSRNYQGFFSSLVRSPSHGLYCG